jgi:hypothetical protein
VSSKFNNFIQDENLIDLDLSDRNFTWAKSHTSPIMAKLDKFLCSLSWNNHFNNSLVKSLSRFSSDHNPIILCSSILHFFNI